MLSGTQSLDNQDPKSQKLSKNYLKMGFYFNCVFYSYEIWCSVLISKVMSYWHYLVLRPYEIWVSAGFLTSKVMSYWQYFVLRQYEIWVSAHFFTSKVMSYWHYFVLRLVRIPNGGMDFAKSACPWETPKVLIVIDFAEIILVVSSYSALMRQIWKIRLISVLQT
jgi:hypothetical protein